MTATNIVTRVRPGGLAASAREVLASSRRDPAAIERWSADGEVWALVDPANEDVAVAAAATGMIGERVVQLHVVQPLEGADAARLLAGIADRCRSVGVRRLICLVADDETELLRLLLDADYRIVHVESGACDRARGWATDLSRDGLWLQCEL